MAVILSAPLLRRIYVFRLHHELLNASNSLVAYYVYILTNLSKHPLYTGMTNSIERRTWEHKNPDHEDFCARYRIDRLVYFEEFSNVIHAITREKQIKNMHRIDKMKLIVSMNPEWKDLSEGWFVRHRYQPDQPKCIDPEFAMQTQDDKPKE